MTITEKDGGSYKDALLAVDGCYKITSDIQQRVYIQAIEHSMKGNGTRADVEQKSYFISKKDFQIDLQTNIKVELKGEIEFTTAYMDVANVYNPNTFNASAEVSDDFIVYSEKTDSITSQRKSVNNLLYTSFATFTESTNETFFSHKTTLKIKGNKSNYPEKVFEAKKGVYTKDTKDLVSGLNGGEIVAIVISVILVVGIVTFLIIWFIVLKKPCFCRKHSEQSSNEYVELYT